eukprot:GFUD01023983.1.p1 GENE.GFUD01023983.1~~GFUD01023983.1.p1  ORF type:complete len:491 (+),score=131.99 GFUD01023983.1:108-1580(+)
MLSEDDYDGPGGVERREIQDNVHGLITLSPLAYSIINTDVFKRLKQLKQLGNAHEVFPSGNHTRFEHSLGVMHIAGQLCEALGQGEVTETDKLCVEIAGLCHDLGHGPYSHLWEVFVRSVDKNTKWTHEQSSLDMLDLILKRYKIQLSDYKLNDNDLIFIKELIFGPLEGQDPKKEYPYKGRGPEKYFLYEIISNKITGIDVDKWDYFLRDNLNLKIGITFDHKRFLKNMALKDWPFFEDDKNKLTVKRIAIRDKEFDNCQEMFLDRSRLHRKGYQHRVVKMFDKMMVDVWTAANDHFPLLTGQAGKFYKLSEACEDVVALSKLTDEWVNQSIRNSSDPGLEEARNILKRIDDRDKYKIIAQIENGSIEGSECYYEESLRETSGLLSPTEADTENQAILRPEDLCIFKKNINMGRKDKTNPVLSMLFYDKHGKVVVKKEDELREIAPAKIYEEQLFVLCRRNNPELVGQARNAVQNWADKFPGWTTKYLL